VIAQLVAAAEMAKLTMEPGQIINALKSIAQISGYYRQQEVESAGVSVGAVALNQLSDKELLDLIEAGAA